METLLIWGITTAVILSILVPYVIRFRRKQKADLERLRESQSLGLRPRAQYPLIDTSICIGCGSCVLACPEGDVLGIVFGKATIVNGERCVGHGYCETACPVGAIKVGLGEIKARDDIPAMDTYNETNVKGVFVAGELGGISLIRNAVTQGRAVVDRIADLIAAGSPEREGEFDVIIVGSGPAGLSAALQACRRELSYLVLDQQDPGGTILQYPRRKLVMTQPVEIPLYGKLNKPEYTKEDLLDTWRRIIDQFRINVRPEERVDRVIPEDAGFQVTTPTGTYRTRYVVLAMGRRGTPRKLGVPGEELPKVMYQLVDARSYNDNDILVVGGGDSAIEAAVGLARQKGNRVSISYRKPKFFRIKKKNEERANELIKQGKIKPIFNSAVTMIEEGKVLVKTESDVIELPNDYVFVFAGGIPPFEMLKKIGIEFGGEVKAMV